MTACWMHDADDRPNFKQICLSLSDSIDIRDMMNNTEVNSQTQSNHNSKEVIPTTSTVIFNQQAQNSHYSGLVEQSTEKQNLTHYAPLSDA